MDYIYIKENHKTLHDGAMNFNESGNDNHDVLNQELDATNRMIQEIRQNPDLVYNVFSILQDEPQISAQEGSSQFR